MKGLTEIGFHRAGEWQRDEIGLKLHLEQEANTPNILYAFVVNGQLCYIGKTTQPLKKRMYFYQNPGKTQSTNIKNNAHILAALESGQSVEIYVLADDGSQRRGPFHLNIAAGLEDSIIAELKPCWNHKRQIKAPVPAQKKEAKAMKQSAEQNTFAVRLGKAYYEMGFFNVGVKDADKFGPDGAEILVRLGKNGRTITATINRRANGNATPRIMCGTAYRDWAQKAYQMGDGFSVDVLSPLSVELY